MQKTSVQASSVDLEAKRIFSDPQGSTEEAGTKHFY